MKSIIIGTAGHIDHGKTALVKALTGIDADRLEEEKRRGITIDIGFAHLELAAPSGEILRLGFVDVPGHERFVRNMLAGIGGIDLVFLVIAADESIKPQTREHFDICRLLGVRRGITVLTKSDTVDSETLNVVKLEVEEFLRGSFLDSSRSPIITVSALTGAGIPELKHALSRIASEISARDVDALPRLPIDRVFTMKGFGTVVTGTLVSGSIHKEDELEVFPHGTRVRVRGVQVHGETTDRAVAGERTALNLSGIDRADLKRGMTLASPATLQRTSRLDVALSLLPSSKPLKDRARVHFHAYTSETIVEVSLHEGKQLGAGETAFAQLRLADPILLLPGDRFIVRQFSPVTTIGGGSIVDAAPIISPKEIRKLEKSAKNKIHAFSATLDRLVSDNRGQILITRVLRRSARGLSIDQAIAETGWTKNELESMASQLIQGEMLVRFADKLFAYAEIELAQANVASAMAEYHEKNPLAQGINREQLHTQISGRFGTAPELFEATVKSLVEQRKVEISGEWLHLAGRAVVMKDEEAEANKKIDAAFASAGLTVPALKDVLAGLKVDKTRAQKIVTLLLRDKVLVKIADDLVFHRSVLDELKKRITEYKTKSSKINVAQFKDLTGVSRKYAIPLLEFLDRERITRRIGDERQIL
jgi:selenocysteine-specific elongation factor